VIVDQKSAAGDGFIGQRSAALALSKPCGQQLSAGWRLVIRYSDNH